MFSSSGVSQLNSIHSTSHKQHLRSFVTCLALTHSACIIYIGLDRRRLAIQTIRSNVYDRLAAAIFGSFVVYCKAFVQETAPRGPLRDVHRRMPLFSLTRVLRVQNKAVAQNPRGHFHLHLLLSIFTKFRLICRFVFLQRLA
ncbi:hypothetical protein L596_014585 [Steinernema carpocapsae]|uniref:Uncharacterized protein n=1 Tax=Steinernema carpocapsae TaxID=34508 RepID=A0A4U5ND84_STECR|nr:hypothetical protein L596_014585 [Steinernema carpocapsae]